MSKNEDGYEAVKLVMDDYELRDDNEYYLDDLEDNAEECEEREESEYGLMNDDGDEASEGMEDDSETEADDDRREVINQLNHERQQEIASLTRELADNYELTEQQSTFNGVMAVNYVIHASQLRIAELRNEIALSRR